MNDRSCNTHPDGKLEDTAGKSPASKSRWQAGLPAALRRVLPIFLLLLVCGGLVHGLSAAEPGLSATEKQWLAAHPVIRLGIRELPPLVLQQDGTNRFAGIGMDYVRLIERRLGMRFTVVYYSSWSLLLDAARNREVDVLVTVPQTRERSGYLDFSPPYYVSPREANGPAIAGAAGIASPTNEYGFSSRNDWPQLGVILAKTLAAVPAVDREVIRRRWADPDTWDSPRRPRSRVAEAVITVILILLGWHYHQRIRHFFGGSIRRNLILVVILSAVPALGIILYAGLEKRGARIHEAKHETDHLVGQTANWVERTSRLTRQSLAAITQIPGLQTADDQQLAATGNGLLQSQRLSDTFIFNRQGDILAAGRADLAGKINIAQLEIAREVISNQCFVVGNSVMSSTYAYPMIHFALPIATGPGAGAYFAAKAVQMDTLGIEFDRAHFPQGTTLAITDRRGILLYRYPVPAAPEALGQPIPKTLWDMVSGPAISGVADRLGPDGTSWLWAWRQLSLDAIPSPDLFLLVSLPQDRLLASANRLLWRDLLLLAVATLGAVVIAVALGNRMLLNLLERIAAAARNVGAGHLGARVGLPVWQRGELGELARTFDTMAASLERDQVERQRAGELLRQSEERFSKAFRTSPYAIAITRAGDGRIIEVNDAFTSISDYTREEALGGSSGGMKLWVNEEDRNRVISDLLAGRKVADKEFSFRKRNGDIITGLFSAQVIQLGSETCILSSINDITQRKQAEARLSMQLEELRRWHEVTLGRENRILELKREVNELLARSGQPPRYPSAMEDGPDAAGNPACPPSPPGAMDERSAAPGSPSIPSVRGDGKQSVPPDRSTPGGGPGP